MGIVKSDTIDLNLLSPIFERYRGQKGALIPILQKAQDVYGYLPREVLQEIADYMDVSLGNVYGVATFYAQFYLEPRGKHVLRLCDGTACHVRGTPKLVTALEDGFKVEAGKTTEDGELTLEIVYCIGSCALAPVGVLDDAVIGKMKPDTVVRKVKKLIKEANDAEHAAE